MSYPLLIHLVVAEDHVDGSTWLKLKLVAPAILPVAALYQAPLGSGYLECPETDQSDRGQVAKHAGQQAGIMQLPGLSIAAVPAGGVGNGGLGESVNLGHKHMGLLPLVSSHQAANVLLFLVQLMLQLASELVQPSACVLTVGHYALAGMGPISAQESQNLLAVAEKLCQAGFGVPLHQLESHESGKQLQPEEALQAQGCLLDPKMDVQEAQVQVDCLGDVLPCWECNGFGSPVKLEWCSAPSLEVCYL